MAIKQVFIKVNKVIKLSIVLRFAKYSTKIDQKKENLNSQSRIF